MLSVELNSKAVLLPERILVEPFAEEYSCANIFVVVFKFITKKRASKVQAIENKALNHLKCTFRNIIKSIISPRNFTSS
jgi:hypothetical protein